METARGRGWGVVAAGFILLGYTLFPSGTLVEWTLVALAFFVGIAWGLFYKGLVLWRELGGAVLTSCLLIVIGVGTRMLHNDFTLADTILLLRDEKFVLGSLLPLGYCLLAGIVGFALARCLRTFFAKLHAMG